MTRSLNLLSLGMVTVALAGAVTTASAQQDVEALRRRLKLDVPAARSGGAGLSDLFRGAPGTNTGTPLAFGASMGDVFVGGGYQNQTRAIKQANGTFNENSVTDDGSVSVGFGLGNGTDGISLTTVVTSLSTFRSGLGNRTAFSFAASRNINPTTAIAIGVENLFISGGGDTDGTDSWYGVLSKVMVNPVSSMGWLKALTVSGGLGNGRFRFIDDVNDGKESVNVFGSVAALVHEQVSLISDWTGQDLNVGMSIVPFKKFPVAVTPALADVLGIANSGPRFTLGMGIGMHF